MIKSEARFYDILNERIDAAFFNERFISLINNIKSISYKPLYKLVNFSSESWNQKDYFEDYFPYIEISAINIHDGTIAEINNIEKVNAPSRAKKVVRNDDIIVSTTRPNRGAISFVRNINNIVIASTGFAIIRENSDEIFREYLYIILRQKSSLLQMEQRSSGGNYPAITEDELKKILIPLPPKNIQQKIIDLYQYAVKEKQTQEQEAKTLLAGIDDYLMKELGIALPKNVENERHFEVGIFDLIGDRLDTFYNNPRYSGIDEKISSIQYSFKKFKEICYSVSGVIYSRDDESEKGKAILRGNNITLETNELNFESIRYIKDSINISDDLKLKKNDILMSSASGSKEHVGKVAIIEKDIEYYFGGFMMVLRQKEKNYNQKYFFSFLQSSLFRSYLYRNLGGTNINNLNFGMLANLKIPFPPVEKQNEIAEHIQSIRTKARQLQEEAREVLEKAKIEIEKMIVGV